jgi:hypothetical protein
MPGIVSRVWDGIATRARVRRPSSAHRRSVSNARGRSTDSRVDYSGWIVFPRHRRSDLVIRHDSLTVAGAVPDWPKGFTGFPFTPQAHRQRGTSARPIITGRSCHGSNTPVRPDPARLRFRGRCIARLTLSNARENSNLLAVRLWSQQVTPLSKTTLPRGIHDAEATTRRSTLARANHCVVERRSFRSVHDRVRAGQ